MRILIINNRLYWSGRWLYHFSILIDRICLISPVIKGISIDLSFSISSSLFFLCSLLTFFALLLYNKVYEFGFDVAISVKLGIRFTALFDTRKACLWLFSLTWLVRTEILQRRFQYFSETWINYRKPGNRKKRRINEASAWYMKNKSEDEVSLIERYIDKINLSKISNSNKRLIIR